MQHSDRRCGSLNLVCTHDVFLPAVCEHFYLSRATRRGTSAELWPICGTVRAASRPACPLRVRTARTLGSMRSSPRRARAASFSGRVTLASQDPRVSP
jgi:hypothetical protein